MKHFSEYNNHKSLILGKRKKFDNNIYTFDIETSSYIIFNNKQYNASYYEKLNEDEKKLCEFKSCMYIWMFGINDTVYYGRTWDDLKQFLEKINNNIPEKKILFIHNLSFEFQFLIGNFKVKNVLARKSHKVMRCELEDYNFELRCTLMMTNCKLNKLPDLFHLPVKKLDGDLDYNLIRTSITPLSEKELHYCENDCLVVYHYIKFELKNYENVNKLPLTSTGHVRRELKERVLEDYKYKRIVRKAINTDPHVYNLLQQAFMGGYTHANWIYTDEILHNIDSWDFTSSYPYVLVTHKYPSTEFKSCNIKSIEEMSKRLAYLLVVKFKNIKCNYNNTFISESKCRNIRGAIYDNGRIISASEFEITLTDVDFRFILDTHTCEYEIIESYYSQYNYLPKQFIEFVLEKYVIKTQYKGVEEKELEYNKEKAKFNALYGMSVTNNIRDNVIFENGVGWSEVELTNDEIIDALNSEKKSAFLSFAYGVWVTAHARNNLLRNVKKLDDYVVYCDTDSIKLLSGYDRDVIDHYNDFVTKKINYVSKLLEIDYSKFAPKDIKNKERMLGLFDSDGHYKEFITQGAKKYAVKINIDKDKITDIEKFKKQNNIVKEYSNSYDIIKITVSGVPKKGAFAIKDLSEFKDNLIFKYEDTGKNLLVYIDNQDNFLVKDYLNNEYLCTDKTGCCILPNTYELSKSLEYANLLTENSSKRAIYKEV